MVDANQEIAYQDAQGNNHRQSLLGGHVPLGDVARRITAYGHDGAEIAMEASDFTTLDRAKMEQIAEIRVETRPYLWAEFKDIVLTQIP